MRHDYNPSTKKGGTIAVYLDLIQCALKQEILLGGLEHCSDSYLGVEVQLYANLEGWGNLTVNYFA
jgi:hypothetical protein